MSGDSLGDRMKENYENVFRQNLIRRMPVIIRVDGRAFHSVTKNCDKPFDGKIIDAMVYAAKQVAEDMQGFKIGYVQSDEATFVLTDYETFDTQGWFDYNLSKMISISASVMTFHFNERWAWLNSFDNKRPGVIINKPLPIAYFDSRAFNIPREEVSNALLWRAKDWERNSIGMYARAFFSHKELLNKSCVDMHEMLHKIGKNWTTDLSDREKNGTFLVRTEAGVEERTDVIPKFEEINKIVDPLINMEKLPEPKMTEGVDSITMFRHLASR